MPPTRRMILRTTGLLTAGVFAGGSADGNNIEQIMNTPDDKPNFTHGDFDESTKTPSNNASDTAYETRPAGIDRSGIMLRSIDDAPALSVKPSVEVVKPRVTDEHPPRLRVTLENTSNERVTVGEGRSIFFQFVSDDSRKLVLLPTGGKYPAKRGCWRLTEEIAITMEYQTVSLDPGESHSKCLDLYATPDEGSDACFPMGEFRFETRYNVEPQSEKTPVSSFDGETPTRCEDEKTSAEPPSEKMSNGRTQATWGFLIGLE